MITVIADTTGKAVVEYDKATDTMHFHHNGKVYPMAHKNGDFEFAEDAPIDVLAQQELLNDGIFETTVWLDL